MDSLQKSRIFEVAASVFSTLGRAGIDAWVSGFQGSEEERAYVGRIYQALLDNSRDSGRVLCLYDSRITKGLGLEERARLRALSEK
ncbi:hypothetical protein FJZ17_00225 [Candidatus Pacearchaeota archaeon]|nr:hypothetical protein [Candidatus Pacearchaeota archaeon]